MDGYVKKFLLIAWSLVILAPQGVLAQGQQLAADTPVAALFNDGNWYAGTIDRFEDGCYIINTSEGRQSCLDRSRLKVLSPDLQIKQGEKVAALYGSEKFYGGTVLKLEAGGAIIKWADGSEPGFVDKAKIITGVGDYDYRKKSDEDPASLITATIGGTEFQVSKKTGRVYINKSWAGTFDLASGSLSPHSLYNASGKIEPSGNFYVLKGTSMSGYLSKSGEVFVRGKKILTIDKAVSGGRDLSWKEKCLIALVSAVYLKY